MKVSNERKGNEVSARQKYGKMSLLYLRMPRWRTAIGRGGLTAM